MARQFVKYNPAFLESDKLVENFVVRQADLKMIVRIVQENSSESNQHVLVVGPRGCGKTTLVRRVSVEIERDEYLKKRWYPLVFAEESYNALSAADFWLESIFHLAEQTGEQRWMESYQELRRDPDEKRLAKRALGTLLDYADGIGKRILLIVENLDMLLSEFSSEEEAWSLRHTLMNEPRLMLLATATARSDAIENLAKPMFEMFQVHDLNPLSDAECNAIWALVAKEALPGEEIRPIRILTGGNARLIALLARFGAKRSFRELLEDLVDLIDEHTDYFKSHLDNMAPKERKIYLALADLWKPATAKEIAESARIGVNTTSALLKRLSGRGKVVVDDEGKRKKWYSISEGIYNIYYLMRRRGGPSARVKAAVRFMVSLYKPVSAAKVILDESCTLMPDECRHHMMALGEIYQSAPLTERLEIAKLIPSSVFDSPYLDKHIREDMILHVTKTTSGEVVNTQIKKTLDEIKTQFERAEKLFYQQQYEASLGILEKIIDKYEGRHEVDIVERVASAMFNKGYVLGKMDRFGESVVFYDEVIAKYGDRQEAGIAERVASAMVNKGYTLRKMDRFEESVVSYDAVIAKYGDRQEAEIAEQVASAMVNKGYVLGKMDRFGESVASYDEVIAKYGDRQEAEIAERVASAMVNKGYVLGKMDRFEESVASCDAVIAKYGDRKEPAIVYVTKRTRLVRAKVLLLFQRIDEAFDDIKYINESHDYNDDLIDRMIDLFCEFAAYGYAEKLLDVLVGSPAEAHLEPLVAALRLYCGHEVRTATEILEVAKDVVKRIEERKLELENRTH